ncbi:hypothetical protein HYV79_04750 [Candidatus Woesearchaeota archaeon]|nr:hypothetical protein [Candidatus Woesearchaeota archaeon]
MDFKKKIIEEAKQLSKYSKILNIKEFNVVLEETSLNYLLDELLKINMPNIYNQESMINLWENYKAQWINFVIKFDNVLVKSVWNDLQLVIDQIIILLNEPADRREMINWKKIKNILLEILSAFKQLRKFFVNNIFTPENIVDSGLSVNQICDFILDKSIGVGAQKVWNVQGAFNPLKRLKNYDFNIEELRVIIRYLTKPPKNEIRTANDWIDLGAKKSPVRIILKSKKTCSESCVYAIFKVSEHRNYERILANNAGTIPCNH